MEMIDREKVISEFEDLLNAAKGNYQDFVDLTIDGGEEILALLKEQEVKEQISDVIHEMAKPFRRQIVMCKDCKHGEPCDEGDVYCTKDIGTFESSVHKPEWFCADGERREAE